MDDYDHHVRCKIDFLLKNDNELEDNVVGAMVLSGASKVREFSDSQISLPVESTEAESTAILFHRGRT